MCRLRNVGDAIVFSEVLKRTGLHDFLLERISARIIPSNTMIVVGECESMKIRVIGSDVKVDGSMSPDYCPSFIPVFANNEFLTGVVTEVALKLCYQRLPKELKDKLDTRPGHYVDDFFVLYDGKPIRVNPVVINIPGAGRKRYNNVLDYINDVYRTCCSAR